MDWFIVGDEGEGGGRTDLGFENKLFSKTASKNGKSLPARYQ